MSRAGAAWTDMDRPVAAADPVIWRTSRFWTVSCIHVPALDTKFARDHQRMLRCLRDRQGERDAASAAAAVGAGAGVDRAGVGEEDTVRYSETSRRTLRRGAGSGTPAALRGGSRHRDRARPIVAEGTAESSPDVRASLWRVRQMRCHVGNLGLEWG
ncbi:hypothetical protein GCM10019016_134290 [Streptomyces prasinosporus]|uniref:Uncharacterized protein n=1 Tax=Streptomyces prasinosporus TaxID=68256 RepID=A0ABP6UIK8_9ACTN